MRQSREHTPLRIRDPEVGVGGSAPRHHDASSARRQRKLTVFRLFAQRAETGAVPIEPDERGEFALDRPVHDRPVLRGREVVFDHSVGNRERRTLDSQPNRIERLRDECALTHIEQVASGIRCRPWELGDSFPVCRLQRSDEERTRRSRIAVQEPPVWKELRQEMVAFAVPRIHSRDGDGGSAFPRAPDGPIQAEEDSALNAPVRPMVIPFAS